mmetsp:Transcript_86105/g.238615  ORF Transcript_86105/g.238615 Transcript_86105/m.238615 type:complete len:298 (+) Transcript_86105:687-1580(+)
MFRRGGARVGTKPHGGLGSEDRCAAAASAAAVEALREQVQGRVAVPVSLPLAQASHVLQDLPRGFLPQQSRIRAGRQRLCTGGGTLRCSPGCCRGSATRKRGWRPTVLRPPLAPPRGRLRRLADAIARLPAGGGSLCRRAQQLGWHRRRRGRRRAARRQLGGCGERASPAGALDMATPQRGAKVSGATGAAPAWGSRAASALLREFWRPPLLLPKGAGIDAGPGSAGFALAGCRCLGAQAAKPLGGIAAGGGGRRGQQLTQQLHGGGVGGRWRGRPGTFQRDAPGGPSTSTLRFLRQ